MKKIAKSAPVQFLLTAILAAYMNLVRITTRWTVVGREHVAPLWEAGGGVVWCMWHSGMVACDALWPKDRQPVLVLTSQSRDANISTRAIEWMRRSTVRGSTAKKTLDGTATKGSIQAFRAMVAHAKAGGCVCMTPDGPRGPRMRAQPGPIRVAKAAGVPIIPTAWAIAGTRRLGTWDRMAAPPLFGRGVQLYGRPINVPATADAALLEALRQQLEDELTRLLNEAEALVGGQPVEPAPLAGVAPAGGVGESAA